MLFDVEIPYFKVDVEVYSYNLTAVTEKTINVLINEPLENLED